MGGRRRISGSEAALYRGRFSWRLAAIVAAIVIVPFETHLLLAGEAVARASHRCISTYRRATGYGDRVFSAASGYQVMMYSQGVPPRRSEAIHRVLPPKAVLEMLVAGTGLIVKYAGEKAVVLLPDPRMPSAPGTAHPSGAEQGYYAALQDAVLGALCRSALTRPGSYRAALDLWIAASGQIERAELLKVTGIWIAIAASPRRCAPSRSHRHPIFLLGASPCCSRSAIPR